MIKDEFLNLCLGKTETLISVMGVVGVETADLYLDIEFMEIVFYLNRYRG